MPYRSDVHAAQELASTLEREIECVRGPDHAAALHAHRLAELTAELDDVRRRIPGSAPRLLDTIRVARPCKVDWGDLSGTDRVRHCSACNQNVYNFSAMTSAEVEDLLRATEGRICARLYRRWDGSVMTRDCPKAPQPRVRLVVLGGALTTAAAAAYGVSMPVHTLGAMAVDEAESEPVAPRRIPEYELSEVPEDLGESVHEDDFMGTLDVDVRDVQRP